MRSTHRYAEYQVSPWRHLRLLARWRARRPRRSGPWGDDGVDYTGWSARCLHDIGPIRAGTVGRVAGYRRERQGKHWTVVFPGAGVELVEYLTTLPAAGKVELTAP